MRAAVVDGTTVHEQGASDGQELGWVLARGAAMLRTLEAAGIPAEQAFGLLELRLAATDEQFPTIAKLRAARRLWAWMAELCDVPDPRTRIHAVTSRPMTSAFDVHLNLLRATVAAFGAGVGGADVLTVVPFDEPTGEVSELARRLARNTSALLVAESHVAAVADPAGGAYAVERLTDDLALVAWSELGAIETEGDAAFASRVADVRARREADVATRRRPITGLSEYPRLEDPVPGRRNLSYRWGAAFEALRREPSEAHVFLATLGTRRGPHRARRVRHQPAGRRRDRRRRRRRDGRRRRPGRGVRRPDGGLPGRHRRGVRRVGTRGCRRAAHAWGDPRGRGRQAGRLGRRLVCPRTWTRSTS